MTVVNITPLSGRYYTVSFYLDVPELLHLLRPPFSKGTVYGIWCYCNTRIVVLFTLSTFPNAVLSANNLSWISLSFIALLVMTRVTTAVSAAPPPQREVTGPKAQIQRHLHTNAQFTVLLKYAVQSCRINIWHVCRYLMLLLSVVDLAALSDQPWFMI